MGSAQSITASPTVLNKVILDTVVKNENICASNSSNTQNVRFGGTGNLVVGNAITQNFRLNQKCLTEATTIARMQADMTTQLQNAVKKNGVTATAWMDKSQQVYNPQIENEVKLAMTTENISRCIANFNNEQEVIFEGVGNEFAGNEVQQNIDASLDCAAHFFNESGLVANIANDLKNDIEVEQRGLFDTLFGTLGDIVGSTTAAAAIIAVVAFLIFAAIAWVIVSAFGGGSSDENAAAMIATMNAGANLYQNYAPSAGVQPPAYDIPPTSTLPDVAVQPAATASAW